MVGILQKISFCSIENQFVDIDVFDLPLYVGY